MATFESLTATLDATANAVRLARLFGAGDVGDAVELVLALTADELRACLLASAGLHAAAVARSAVLMGCDPETIFDGAVPGMERFIADGGI